MALHIVILAAGQGLRMQSKIPKVLHHLAGKPMLLHVLETAQQLKPDMIHVIYSAKMLQDACENFAINWIMQIEQLGTAHALLQALPFIPPMSQVLVLSADVPLIQVQTLKALVANSNQSSIRVENRKLCLLFAKINHPYGFGRILRNSFADIVAIVEEKDATEAQKQIKEIYSGICLARADYLTGWLANVSKNNAQKEYYLTDIVAMACGESTAIIGIEAADSIEIQGVNDRVQLHQLERVFQIRQAKRLMQQGVSFADADRFDLRGELNCGLDVFIDVNNVFLGEVRLGENCYIGPNCLLMNVSIGANCKIFANSILENCTLDDWCEIGPFARLRPGTQLADNCKIGNFVETKNAKFAAGSKASHLSYLGDVSIGREVNCGAGTITCNYDGANKHQTIIEDKVFIGSGTQLIAPVKVGANATIGAGSTIRKDVPRDELTITESKQKTISGWKRPRKKIIPLTET